MNGLAMSVQVGFVIKSSQTLTTTVVLVSAVQSHMSLQLHNPQQHYLYITNNNTNDKNCASTL